MTRLVKAGNVPIGGGSAISIQSMTNTKTEDVKATVDQIMRLEAAGCEIVRTAVPTLEAAMAIEKIREKINIPLVADIHFDYKLAIAAIESGADKVRINPGNIGSDDRLFPVVEAAKKQGIPIRVGVNSGSLEKHLVEKYCGVTPEGLAESAVSNVKRIEEMGYNNLVISIKASDPLLNLKAHRLLAEKTDYPLHIGITESGTVNSGKVKSAVGIGALLLDGIGDTMRVSLTGDPVREVVFAKEILKAAGKRQFGINIVSCPTCGRTGVDLEDIVLSIEEKTALINKPLTVAVMGCAVNGPGEAKEADMGLAFGKTNAAFFKKGEIIGTFPVKEAINRLIDEINLA